MTIKPRYSSTSSVFHTLLSPGSEDPVVRTVSLIDVCLEPSAFIMVSSTIVFVTPPRIVQFEQFEPLLGT